jgi:hypothetical protein
MAAATAEKKMIVNKVFLAGRGFSRTAASPAVRCLGVARSAWSSVDIEQRPLAPDAIRLHSSRGSCSRAKISAFLLFAGGNLSITEQR